MDQFSESVDIINKLNLTKTRGSKMGISPKRALQNLNFLTFMLDTWNF